MFYNDTRKQIKELARKIMLGNLRRNVFVIIAIAMTTFLISTILAYCEAERPGLRSKAAAFRF